MLDRGPVTMYTGGSKIGSIDRHTAAVSLVGSRVATDRAHGEDQQQYADYLEYYFQNFQDAASSGSKGKYTGIAGSHYSNYFE